MLSGTMMQGKDAHEQSNVTGPIYAKNTKPIFYRSGPELKESDQQN